MECKKTETAGGVVVNKKGQILVVSQKNDTWSLPKGHIDPGEEKLEAAIREIYEESGIRQLTFLKELQFYERYKIALNGGDDESELKTIYMFLFTTEEEDLNPIDLDNPEARWVEPNEVNKYLTHKKDREFFNSIVNEIDQIV